MTVGQEEQTPGQGGATEPGGSTSQPTGFRAYVELTKPRITLFVMITAAAAFLLATIPVILLKGLFHVGLGSGLSTAGALALNQYQERVQDGLMERTRRRPIPTGRISPARARLFGLTLVFAGVGHLWFWLGWAPAAVALLAALLYNGAYTPMKLRSPLATPIGAVPGALPVLIGWTAAGNSVELPGQFASQVIGMVIFGILFLWQMIHVLALGWNLREDYARAGFMLIPPGSPKLISGLMVGYAIALLPLSVVPQLLGVTGGPYLVGAVFLGLGMIAVTLGFLLKPTRQRCSRVFLASLLYHPLLLGMMVIGALITSALVMVLMVPGLGGAGNQLTAQEATQNPTTNPDSRPRAREIGVAVGIFDPGPFNAITDVAGVLVGHTTVVQGDSVRTGVTAIRPHGGNLYRERVPAAVHVGNGFGKLLGVTQVRELGELETPILLTCTLCVWKAADAMVEWALTQEGMENVRSINPLVGETNDGGLNDIRSRPITAEHVQAALESAAGGPVEEGSVGAGTGTSAFGWKGGIGTSSRLLPATLGGYTVGVLVQSNFGGVLQIAGTPVGEELGRYAFRNQVEGAAGAPREEREGESQGSIMIVIATDAPLSDRNLERLASRGVMGLARTGSFASNGSGDYVISFSTAPGVRRRPGNDFHDTVELANANVSALFAAAVEATEEAIYNSIFKATTVSSRFGSREALPIEEVLEVLRRYGVVEGGARSP